VVLTGGGTFDVKANTTTVDALVSGTGRLQKKWGWYISFNIR